MAPSTDGLPRHALKLLRAPLGLLTWFHLDNGGAAAPVAYDEAQQQRVRRAALAAWSDGCDGLSQCHAGDGGLVYVLDRTYRLDAWLTEVGLPAVLVQRARGHERDVLRSADLAPR